MKPIARFLGFVLFAVPFVADATPVATTNGSSLTSYNPGSGASNNNTWNTMMNSRGAASGNSTPKADFGNCNALIMRCATPKCSGGGCTDMNVAASIVSGCVASNDTCKKYGEELVNYMSAQLVASSTAKINEANIAAQNAAAAAAAQQSNAQIQQMQAQMQQMQSEMAAQNAQQMAAMQAALDEQKQLTANAIADATAARESAASASDAVTDSGLTVAQTVAAQNGVSADVLAREQLTGQIITHLEGAENALKEMQKVMQDTFAYAGCDRMGNNCTGPKRVSRFKAHAQNFFDPYETVLNELYDALIMSQSAGVDIGDIYMMLDGSCNVWGQYICVAPQQISLSETATSLLRQYTGNGNAVSDINAVYNSLPRYYTSVTCPNGRSEKTAFTKGGHECEQFQVIPPEDSPSCTLQKMYTDGESVRMNWLYGEEGENGAYIRVGCASSALDNSKFFRSRKRAAQIDIDVLQRIISQDAPKSIGFGNKSKTAEQIKTDIESYCAVGEAEYEDLQKMVANKNLTLFNSANKELCVSKGKAEQQVSKSLPIVYNISTNAHFKSLADASLYCDDSKNSDAISKGPGYQYCNAWYMCTKYANATWDNKNHECNCSNKASGELYRADVHACEYWADYCARTEQVANNVNDITATKCQSCSDYCKGLDNGNKYKDGKYDKTEQSGCKCELK